MDVNEEERLDADLATRSSHDGCFDGGLPAEKAEASDERRRPADWLGQAAERKRRQIEMRSSRLRHDHQERRVRADPFTRGERLAAGRGMERPPS